ncbi:MAG: DUF2164 domain-containing protein [Gammaproteobacteria bacterium]
MIDLSESDREEAISKLQQYLLEELDVELGSFQLQFLLDFFSENIAWRYYNQGLADALQATEKKLDEVAELVYELEQQGPAES